MAEAYDDFAPVQKAKGVMAQAVYQAADNPNDITVTHEFGSVEAAQAFAKSDELKKAMQGAGVVRAQQSGSRTECKNAGQAAKGEAPTSSATGA